MHYLTPEGKLLKNLPFFVYGTLRHAQGNYSWALNGRTEAEVDARMPGLDMYGNHGFPYALINPANTQGIVGELMYISDANFFSVLDSLDMLEGYDSSRPDFEQHYIRIEAFARVGEHEVQAYTYVASPGVAIDVKQRIPKIESGDWNITNPPRSLSHR
jgi:gamma-glutamylcyclotransferase (GGCT)/AIG2-like uncharacterized protein YtfP